MIIEIDDVSQVNKIKTVGIAVKALHECAEMYQEISKYLWHKKSHDLSVICLAGQ